MSNEERINLIRALVAASNAFHDVMREHGFAISYGLDNTKTGSIKKLDVPAHESWSLGNLTIAWDIK